MHGADPLRAAIIYQESADPQRWCLAFVKKVNSPLSNMDALSHAPVRPNESQGPTILGATLTVTIAAFITIIARLYVRLRMIRNVGWDVSCRLNIQKCVLLTVFIRTI
jgi:hypothetical protein